MTPSVLESVTVGANGGDPVDTVLVDSVGAAIGDSVGAEVFDSVGAEIETQAPRACDSVWRR